MQIQAFVLNEMEEVWASQNAYNYSMFLSHPIVKWLCKGFLKVGQSLPEKYLHVPVSYNCGWDCSSELHPSSAMDFPYNHLVFYCQFFKNQLNVFIMLIGENYIVWVLVSLQRVLVHSTPWKSVNITHGDYCRSKCN